MRHVKVGKSGVELPVFGIGTLRLWGHEVKHLESFFDKALELGCNFFDFADCYHTFGANGYLGECDDLFAQAFHMTPSKREKVFLQTKAGMVDGVGPNGPMDGVSTGYDLSKEHILESVDGSLKRLQTDYIDFLLLHMPDPLMVPEKIAEAFDILEAQGKVRHFGVSNFTPYQIELLKTCVKQDLVVNQLQFGPAQSGLITHGMYMNIDDDDRAINRDDSVLDYCRLKQIAVQCYGAMFSGYAWTAKNFLTNPKYEELNKKLAEIGEKYGACPTAVAVAWILRHPANMSVVLGTCNETHLEETVKAAEIDLTWGEWYDIYFASGHYRR